MTVRQTFQMDLVGADDLQSAVALNRFPAGKGPAGLKSGGTCAVFLPRAEIVE